MSNKPRKGRPIFTRDEAWSLLCYFKTAVKKERAALEWGDKHNAKLDRIADKLEWLSNHGYPVA